MSTPDGTGGPPWLVKLKVFRAHLLDVAVDCPITEAWLEELDRMFPELLA